MTGGVRKRKNFNRSIGSKVREHRRSTEIEQENRSRGRVRRRRADFERLPHCARNDNKGSLEK